MYRFEQHVNVSSIDFSVLPMLTHLSWFREQCKITADIAHFPFVIGTGLKQLFVYNEPVGTINEMFTLLQIPNGLEMLRIECEFSFSNTSSNDENCLHDVWSHVGKTLLCLEILLPRAYNDNSKLLQPQNTAALLAQWCSKLLALRICFPERTYRGWTRWWFSEEHVRWFPQLQSLYIGDSRPTLTRIDQNDLNAAQEWANHLQEWANHLQECQVHNMNVRCMNTDPLANDVVSFLSMRRDHESLMYQYKNEKMNFEFGKYPFFWITCGCLKLLWRVIFSLVTGWLLSHT